MNNSLVNIPEYLRNLFIEALFQYNSDKNTVLYGYVTFDKSKLKGPRIDDVKNDNIRAQGIIPVTKSEYVEIQLYSDVDDFPSDFRMNYERILNEHDNIPLKSKFKSPAHRLHIGVDIGPPFLSHYPIEVKYLDINNEILSRSVILQEERLSNYESAISAVFAQVEKLSNPLIGAQFWLSPTEMFPDRVKWLAERRELYKISTSLSVVARAINIQLYEETRTGIITDEGQFWDICEAQLQLIREKEKKIGGPLTIAEVHYPTEISLLPFPLFIPEGAAYDFRAIEEPGRPVVKTVHPLSTASEKKERIRFANALESNEEGKQKTHKKAAGVKDSFITETALPKGSIAGWVKYHTSVDFDSIRISFDDYDVGIKKDDFIVKNTTKVINIENSKGKGILEVPRTGLILDGYIGFVCKYSSVPNTEKEIPFEIEFLKEGVVIESLRLVSMIIRPIVRMPRSEVTVKAVESSDLSTRLPVVYYRHFMSGSEPISDILGLEKLEIFNVGSAEAKGVQIRIGSTNPSIKASLIPSSTIQKTYGFFGEKVGIPSAEVEIKGKGTSVIRLYTDYYDELGNYYSDTLKEEPFVKKREEPMRRALPISIQSIQREILVPVTP